MTATITTNDNDIQILVPDHTATYRKNQAGVWIVFARHDDLVQSRSVGMIAVTKKDGSIKHERIAKVGKTFVVDGQLCAYGYIDDGYYMADVDGPIYLYRGVRTNN